MKGVQLPRQKKEPTVERKYTAKQLNTKRVLRTIVAEYDNLLAAYNSNPTSANRSAKSEYERHLKSANQLSEYFLEYIDAEKIEDVLLGQTRIRELISFELEDGELVTVDGLIRVPKYVAYNNAVSATGNTVTIILPPPLISGLIDILKTALINESALIITPCSNMIIVIETGKYSKEINESLYNITCEATMNYLLEHNLTPKDKSTTIKIVAN